MSEKLGQEFMEVLAKAIEEDLYDDGNGICEVCKEFKEQESADKYILIEGIDVRICDDCKEKIIAIFKNALKEALNAIMYRKGEAFTAVIMHELDYNGEDIIYGMREVLRDKIMDIVFHAE